MCEMVECLSRRTWLSDDQLCALLGAFSDQASAKPVAFVSNELAVIGSKRRGGFQEISQRL